MANGANDQSNSVAEAHLHQAGSGIVQNRLRRWPSSLRKYTFGWGASEGHELIRAHIIVYIMTIAHRNPSLSTHISSEKTLNTDILLS